MNPTHIDGRRARGLVATALASGLLALPALGDPAPGPCAQGQDSDSPGRSAEGAEVDSFHPNRDEEATPLYGGRVIVHTPSLPENMNYAIENSGYTRRWLYEVHETLLLQDWWTTEFVPNAAKSFTVEDLVVLASDAESIPGEIEAQVIRRGEGEVGRRSVRALYGEVDDSGVAFTVTPRSKGHALDEAVEVPRKAVERIEKGAVFTFELNEGVKWHPSRLFEGEDAEKIAGQTLDAEDVRFSWSIYDNPLVDCDEKRFMFQKFPTCEIVDPLTVRFFCEKQDAFALSALGDGLTLLPSHIYDLMDEDNPLHEPDASSAAQAEFINDNEHNKLWVGIGPYQVTAWDQEKVEATRFVDESGAPAYFDADTRPGYFDSIRWRYIQDDQSAMNALLNEELDFFERVKSEDYFGERTESESFTENFYKGYFYTGAYNITGWNLYDPALKEVVVRKAMEMAFDSEAFRKNQYNGLARTITGPVPYIFDGYDHSIEPVPYDPDLALEMLEDEGWYDRDGNGIADKDGVELEIEFLYPGGNDASKIFGRALQQAVEPLGIKINLETMEWATFLERIRSREFQGVSLAWLPDLESDPEQLWHSKWGAYEKKSSNLAGLTDPEVDAQIEAIQTEVDRPARIELWKEFHRMIYERHPYFFHYNVPRKYAMNLKIRGVRHTPISPGYVTRDWYYVDDSVPGTRSTLMK